MPGTTQVPCHSGPGVRLHSWWMESFLTLILLILVQIPVLGQNLRLSVVLMMNLFFPIFVRQIPKVIQRPMDPPRLPLPQYGRHRKESSVHGRGKISNRAANSEFFMKNPLWKLSWILSRSWIAKRISEISTHDPPIFKRQLIQTCLGTSVRRFFLPKPKKSPKFFRQ